MSVEADQLLSECEDSAPRYEKAVLGTLLLCPELFGLAEIPADQFPTDTGRRTYQAMVWMREDAIPIDILNVQTEMGRRHPSSTYEDGLFLSSAVDEVPGAVMTEEKFRYYVAQIRNSAALRAAIPEMEAAVRASRGGQLEDVRRSLEHAQKRLAEADLGNGKKIIRTLDDIPDPLADGDDNDVEWLVPGIIAKGEVTVIAGAPGAGKSWLALALYRAAVMGSTWLGREVRPMSVLYIDRENSKGTLKARIRLIAKGPGFLKPWGKWLDPPMLGDRRLMEFAKQGYVLIFDSLIRFHSAESENDSSDMAVVMNQLKDLANAGATVIVIHHAGKNGASRGSSEITCGCDAALTLTKREGGMLELKSEKIRDVDDFTITIRANFETGSFEAVESPETDRRNADIERLQRIVAANPGITQNAIVKEFHGNKQRVSQLLAEGEGRYWRVQHFGKRKSYFPLEPVLATPSGSVSPLPGETARNQLGARVRIEENSTK